MNSYIPLTHFLKHDQKNRDDQETWDLVGNDPTTIRLRSALADIMYHLGEDEPVIEKFYEIVALYEEALYDKLSYS